MPGTYLDVDEATNDYIRETALDTSTGAADAGAIVALGPDGVLDDSVLGAAESGADVVLKTGANGRLSDAVMPVGIGTDAVSLTASEAIGVGNLVNVWSDAGTFKVRKADASNNRPAHGFVKDAVAQDAVALVYWEGTNDGVTGLADARVFLDVLPGKVTTTAPTGNIILQEVGTAGSPTSFYFTRGKVTHLGP
jgi:hypothetical protein